LKHVIGRSFVLFAAAAAAPAFADEPKPAPQQPAPAPAPQASAPIQPAGSSDDLNAAIDSARPRPAGIFEKGPVSLLDPTIDDMNKKLDESIGLKIGLAYTFVYQNASDGEDDDAAGGDADLFARWRVLGDEDSRMRSIVGVYTEYRHDVGSQPPRALAAEFGSLWGTTNNFDTHDFSFTQVWWEQHLMNDRLVLTAGKLDATNHYNKYRYQDDATAFMSEAFSGNPARAFPDNGLGANGKLGLGDALYVSAGFQDANADKQESGFDTVDEGDWFVAGEFGWTPNFDKLGKGLYSITLWHIEDGSDTGIPSDEGVAISCEQEIGKTIVPFFRAAWSDGDATGVDEFVAAGVGLEGLLRGKSDLTGLGLAWGSPTFSALDDQVSAEVFHRFQVAPDVQLTAGLQYFMDPSFAPSFDDDDVVVLELRLRIAF
jgi:porin